jgi:hypothetical protein
MGAVVNEERHEQNQEDGDDVDDDNDGYGEEKRLTNREIGLLELYDGHAGPLDDRLFPILEQTTSAALPHDGTHHRLQDALSASRGLKVVNLDLVMSLVVLSCPNIQSVDLSLCDRFEQALLATALGTSPIFSDLSRIKLRRHGQRDEWSYRGGLGTLATIFERQHVSALHVLNDNLKQFAISTYNGSAEQTVTWPGMRSIFLQDCKMSPHATAKLLRICPNLISLELKSATGIELDYLRDHGEVLREQGQGLRRLVIDAGDNWIGHEEKLRRQMQRGTFRGVGSLIDLTQLVELAATPWTLLFGLEGKPHLVDILPSKLQSLTLFPCATSELMIDVEQEIRLLEVEPAFADLTINVS